MTKELKAFLLTIALPAILLAAGGVKLLLYTWNSMAVEERGELDEHAEMCFRLLRNEARLAGLSDHGHHRDDAMTRRPKRPRNAQGRQWSEHELAFFLEICRRVESGNGPFGEALAFSIEDMNGKRLYATANFPASAAMTGFCPLAPPLPEGNVSVVRADGGSAIRRRAVAVVVTGACLLLLLVTTLVSGGALFVRTLRRERRESQLKTSFIDNVSHELKTPLAGIRINAELLAEGRIRDVEQRQGALHSILIESDRLSRMVSELLDFSRLEKGTRRYALESFDLGEFVAGLAETQSIAAISNGRARISVKRPGAIVSADKDAVRQIGVNLVSNALKYSEGEIEIEVEGNEIRFLDRGRGVPQGCETRIFERFYRVDNSLTRKEGGSGLGLPIARALARGMGGDLTYAHRSGGGSVFTLTLAYADRRTGGTEK